MAKPYFDTLIRRLGDLQEEARRLEEADYISARYKGYSSEGLTLEEVMARLKKVEREIAKLEERLTRLDDEV
ncbi:hypothetical protein [Lacticaseibacillus zeae]|uniref:Uncharacterized protein n=1 Tax=Lacticaseibacillus zeae TaxID=57037 RepID=A0A5R8LYJ5_LACZE|nr:hypothetical protein [Lacticaseibacillus zeae]TLF42482.1 hypothetical protein FEI14_06225 [Lacticaseibacillus zeae]